MSGDNVLLARQWFLPVRDHRTGASVEPCIVPTNTKWEFVSWSSYSTTIKQYPLVVLRILPVWHRKQKTCMTWRISLCHGRHTCMTIFSASSQKNNKSPPADYCFFIHLPIHVVLSMTTKILFNSFFMYGHQTEKGFAKFWYVIRDILHGIAPLREGVTVA